MELYVNEQQSNTTSPNKKWNETHLIRRNYKGDVFCGYNKDLDFASCPRKYFVRNKPRTYFAIYNKSLMMLDMSLPKHRFLVNLQTLSTYWTFIPVLQLLLLSRQCVPLLYVVPSEDCYCRLFHQEQVVLPCAAQLDGHLWKPLQDHDVEEPNPENVSSTSISSRRSRSLTNFSSARSKSFFKTNFFVPF